jgi:hypothetical protein
MIPFAFDVLSLSLLSTNTGTFPVSTNFTSLAFSVYLDVFVFKPEKQWKTNNF